MTGPPYSGSIPGATGYAPAAASSRATAPAEHTIVTTLSSRVDYLLAELTAYYAKLGTTVFYLEDYGSPVVGGSTGASANGTALRAAAAAANANGGGIIDAKAWGWYLCDWADLYTISTTGNTGSGRTFCHVALGDYCVLGPNLGIKAAVLAGANGTIFNRHVTNLNQTSGNKFCGYLPGFRLDGNASAQTTSGLGGTAGVSAYGDGSFVANGVDFTNSSDEVMKGGIFFGIRGTGSNTAGTTVHANSNGVDVSTWSTAANTLSVASSSTFSSSASTAFPATFDIQTALGPARISFTGKATGSPHTLTGCKYISGPGTGSTIATGNRLGSIETWVVRVQGTGDRHVMTGNTVDGRNPAGTQQDTSSGLCAQTCTGATDIADNTIHHLSRGNGIAINAGTGALNVRGNIVKSNGHSGISVENSDYFAVESNMVDGNGTDTAAGGYGVIINGAGGSSSPGIISGNTIIGTLKQGFTGPGRGLLIQAGGGSANHVNICGGNIIQNNDAYGIDIGVATLVDTIDAATLSMMTGNNGASAEANFNLGTAVNVVPGQYVQSSAGVSVPPTTATLAGAGSVVASPYPFRTRLKFVTGGGVAVTSVSMNGQVVQAGGTVVPASSTWTCPEFLESAQNGGSYSMVYSGGTPTISAYVAP